MNYLSVEEAAKRAGEEGFLQNVWKAVIPILIEKGVLHGQKGKVADDEALARVMGFGIERFVQDQQGWSVMAVRAPIEEVSKALGKRPGVVARTENVKALKMKKDLGIQPAEETRDAFLVKFKKSDWPVLIQTAHWFKSCDAVMVTALACALSKELKTTAMAAWDDDFSGSTMIVCEKGKRTQTVSDESDGWEAMYAFCYERGIYLPNCFIAGDGKKAALHVEKPAEVERADHVVLSVPEALRSGGPHVFEKLGMMAAAVEADLEDEEAFMAAMNDGVWAQAEGVLKGGGF